VEEKYNLGRREETCSVCSNAIPPGGELVSALAFTGVEFERRDYCATCWENVREEDLYSFWRSRVPDRDEEPKKKAVNVHVLHDLFRRLVEEQDPAKEGITFLIGLILVQKRVLKYREMKTEKGKRIVVLGVPRSKVKYTLPDPGMEPEKMDAMREDLKRILDPDATTPGSERG